MKSVNHPRYSFFTWVGDWADGVGLGAVELHELGKIELGLLEDLDLTDEDVLEWEDFIATTGDFLCNLVREAKRIYN